MSRASLSYINEQKKIFEANFYTVIQPSDDASETD